LSRIDIKVANKSFLKKMAFFIKNHGKEMCFLLFFHSSKISLKIIYLFIDKSIRGRGVGSIFSKTINFQSLRQGSLTQRRGDSTRQ